MSLFVKNLIPKRVELVVNSSKRPLIRRIVVNYARVYNNRLLSSKESSKEAGLRPIGR